MTPALITLEITPKTPADLQKLARALQMLAVEDVELRVRPGVAGDSTVIGATGEAHLERIVDRLKREFDVEASVGRPAVVYLETVTRSADGNAKHVKMAHGRGEYAHVSLRLHPGAAGSGYSFEDTTLGGSIPDRFIPSIDRGIREAMANGVPSGFPIVDVRVEVYDGSYHDTDSTDGAFRTAAEMAFLQAAKNAQPVTLEPVMQVEVRADNRQVEVVLQDLLRRRGDTHKRTLEADHEVVAAHVPLSDLFGFEGCLRSQTHGHASCTIRFAYYQPVVRGPAGDDDYIFRVGAPRRPAPSLRSSGASVPEPDDSNTEA